MDIISFITLFNLVYLLNRVLLLSKRGRCCFVIFDEANEANTRLRYPWFRVTGRTRGRINLIWRSNKRYECTGTVRHLF